MTHFDASDPRLENACCVVCEKNLAGDNWFALLKHGEWTVLLCSERCMNAFHAQQLTALRRLVLLTFHPSLKWPQGKTILNQLTNAEQHA